jgi:hypothetical protein
VVSTEPFGPIAVGDQQHAGDPVSDLSAVGAAEPALDGRVVAVVADEASRTGPAVARTLQQME